MAELIAIYGSPRREGNTATLLQQAVLGARSQGRSVQEYYLRDLKLSPCLEIYGCMKDGECVIKDDFQEIRDEILAAKGLMIASPIFFYTVSAHTKIFMDRFQSQWVKKYWLDKVPFGQWTPKRKGLFISAGATKGRKLFEGTLLTVKYFFDVLDMELWQTLLCKGLDRAGDAQNHPEYLQEAYNLGQELSKVV